MDMRVPARAEAKARLEAFDIRGQELYFIDLIPLIGMVWADGMAQSGELAILDEFIHRYVGQLNRHAGYDAFTVREARRFAHRFLEKRPSRELLVCLRGLALGAGMISGAHDAGAALKTSILSACLDIAASSTTRYPYGLSDRFCPEEKRCYFELLDALGSSGWATPPAANHIPRVERPTASGVPDRPRPTQA